MNDCIDFYFNVVRSRIAFPLPYWLGNPARLQDLLTSFPVQTARLRKKYETACAEYLFSHLFFEFPCFHRFLSMFFEISW